jgi:hypothetical protein
LNIFVNDQQVIPETEAQIFGFIQSSPVEAVITLQNDGVNTANYRFQEFNGTAWADLDDLGTDLHNTLSSGQVKLVKVISTYPKVRMVANASGGSVIGFAVTRWFNRVDGADLPILAL